MPEFDKGLYWFGEYQVDDFRHINAGVEHVDGDSDGQWPGFGGVVVFEIVDQCFSVVDGVIDDLAKVAAVLRVITIEDFEEVLGVHMLASKYNGFAKGRASGIFDAVVHEGFPVFAGGVVVEERVVEICGGVVEVFGILELLFCFGFLRIG